MNTSKDYDNYTLEYFKSLICKHQKEKEKETREIVEKIKLHLFTSLEVDCKIGKSSSSIPTERLTENFNIFHDTLLDIIENEIVPYFRTKGLLVEFYKSHIWNCDCDTEEGCVEFIRVRFLENTTK